MHSITLAARMGLRVWRRGWWGWGGWGEAVWHGVALRSETPPPPPRHGYHTI